MIRYKLVHVLSLWDILRLEGSVRIVGAWQTKRAILKDASFFATKPFLGTSEYSSIHSLFTTFNMLDKSLMHSVQ